MVRRRIYHTTEQKVAANRAKSKRSYDKQKDMINKKRRKKYAKVLKTSAGAQNVPLKGKLINGGNEMDTTPPNPQPLTIWLERADRIAARLRKITEDDSKKFLRRIVEEFLQSRDSDKDIVYEQIVAVGKLQKSVYKYENEVLTLAGLGLEYDKVKEITRSVCDVVRWLEEVLCLAMVDAAEVENTYQECLFSFQ